MKQQVFRWVGRLAGVVSLVGTVSAVEKLDVTLDYVAGLAAERAGAPFKSPRGELPPELSEQNLNYDRYREIRFNRDQALWKRDNLPFWAEFFHPGYIYQEPVHMNEFSAEGYAQAIRFAPAFFDYGNQGDLRSKIPAETGYAGFKLLYPVNKPDVMDEVAVFQGASYFRLLGKGMRYGQSVRGLALNTGGADGEEFPLFTNFWLGKPQPGATSLTFYALLDSKSLTGAYQFTLRPGSATACDVDAVLYFRNDAYKAVEKTIGIAPLTSMFWFGENTEQKPDDYRGEVHDSDGLLMHLENETVWRPLNNAREMRHSIFATKNPRGFGLLQRDRDWASYQEIFNLYHKVPSVFIKPKGDWGEGDIRLVVLPTKNEYLDNIVAFWNPAQKPEPMKPYKIGYQIQVVMGTEPELSQTYVKATRVGAALHNSAVRQFAIDFTGPGLDKCTEKEPPTAVASCTPNAHFSENQCLWNPYDKTWRVILKLEPTPDNKDAVNLRCTLKKGDVVLSETWDYQWSPL